MEDQGKTNPLEKEEDVSLETEQVEEKHPNISKKPKKKKGCLKFVIGFFVAVMVVVGLVLGITLGMSDEDDVIELTKNEKTIKEICATTDEQAIAINKILTDCGISEIQGMVHDEMLDGWDNEGDTGYRIQSQDIKNIILYLNANKEVYIIRHADIPIYAEGKCQKHFSDFYLTINQKSDLKYYAEKRVESVLKAPSTAAFPNILYWSFYRDPTSNVVTLGSYVDSQNGFGAMVRSNFYFQYKIEEDSYILVYFEIDDQIVYDNR